MQQAVAFHLAVPVNDVETSLAFYTERLGCTLGRKNPHSCVMNFFGHQVVLHEAPDHPRASNTNKVDMKDVPVPHFGAVLRWDDWHALADRLKASGTEFVIEPHIRYPGTSGEQATMFFYDPSSNALEFKAFRDETGIFSAWKAGEKNGYTA